MLNPAYITGSLRKLSRRDGRRELFGAQGHQYRLNPPITEARVRAFERQNGIALPDEYRFFLTHIGDGGAGPYYGLFKLGEHDDGEGACKWEDGALIGDVSKPFPYQDRWNLPALFWAAEPDLSDDMPLEEQDRLIEAWDERLAAEYWNPQIMNGAIPICHIGCALRHWLVVNGPCKGEVWADHRADNGGIHPLTDETGERLTFERWYCSWLEEALRRFGEG